MPIGKILHTARIGVLSLRFDAVIHPKYLFQTQPSVFFVLHGLTPACQKPCIPRSVIYDSHTKSRMFSCSYV